MKKNILLVLISMAAHTYAMKNSVSTGLIAMEMSDDDDSDNEPVYAYLMKAAFLNDADQVKMYLKEYDFIEPYSIETPWGTNPLNWAAFHGNEQLCRLLLSKGFDITIERDGTSAVHLAALNNKIAALKTLLVIPSANVDTNQPLDTLVAQHFAKMKKILTMPMISMGVQLTPYELVPGPEERSVCKDFLNPIGFTERVQDAVVAYCNRILIDAALPKGN